VASEVLSCTTTKGASALLNEVRSGGSVTSSIPPKRLGSSAVEVSGGGSTYGIYWRRGTNVELVALSTDVSASSSSSTSATTPPITAAQQKVLSSAALEQDSLLS
jgi:hypothetical protein